MVVVVIVVMRDAWFGVIPPVIEWGLMVLAHDVLVTIPSCVAQYPIAWGLVRVRLQTYLRRYLIVVVP